MPVEEGVREFNLLKCNAKTEHYLLKKIFNRLKPETMRSFDDQAEAYAEG